MARSEGETARIRLASIVIIVAMLAWMGLSVLGGRLGLPVRFAFLVDFACLAAFAWALFVLIDVWRRGDGKG
ncbi:MAG: DUF5337 domain-containing protein [Pseudomonadota bacterium]